MSKLAPRYPFRKHGLSWRSADDRLAAAPCEGIGIVFFVSMHILAAFFLYSVEATSFTGAVSEALTEFYEALPMQLFMLFAVLYHAINGLRVVVLDMFPGLWKHNREAMWVQWALFLPMFLLPAALMLMGVTI